MYLRMGHPFGTWPPVSWQLRRRRRYYGIVGIVVAMPWMSSGDGGTLQRRRRCGGACRRWQHTVDRIRVSIGGIMAAQTNLVTRAVIPTYLYMCCATGAYQPIRVGRPRSGRRGKGLIDRWAYWWRSTNILPLDLIPSFNFISFTFVHSITD